MAQIKYKNVGITAMAACVPHKVIDSRELAAIMSEEEIAKVIGSVGIRERRVCDDNVFASDLCFKAAEKLMADNDIDPASIDILLFMSQGADYRIPATACILQRRLGLGKHCAAMDLSLGCSGYVYALSTAFAYASMEGVDRVLLLDGEAFSKIVNPRDKVNAPLYGDAGSATLIEKGDFGESLFILNTDGDGEDAVKIPAGMRIPVTQESCRVTEREDGNFRSDLQVYMDGMDVFNFALRVVPKGVKEILKSLGKNMDDIDFFVFHQSNKFMTDFFVKKLKVDSAKVPYSISRFGNTSSASIPLTIVSELKYKMGARKDMVMCGFGAGLSWATAYVPFKDCRISNIVES